MVIQHIRNKYKKIKFQKPGHKKILEMELQQLEQSNTFKEYHDIPRSGPKRCHVLMGKYKKCFGVGIDHKFRLVLKPLPIENQMTAMNVNIVEYYENYH